MNAAVIQRMPWRDIETRDPNLLDQREWLITNGLGGYASGTLSGMCTRRYHGILIAALPAPLGRFVMLNHLLEELQLLDRTKIHFGGKIPSLDNSGMMSEALKEFRLENGLPVWHYSSGDIELEKRIVMPHRQNTVCIIYKLLAAPAPIRLRIRPTIHFRPHEAAVDSPLFTNYTAVAANEVLEISSGDSPKLRMMAMAEHHSFVLDRNRDWSMKYPLEFARGYAGEGSLWSPGYFRIELRSGDEIMLVASTERQEMFSELKAEESLVAENHRRERLLSTANISFSESSNNDLESLKSKMVLAADQFVIVPTTRVKDVASARAIGDDARAIIAGYHWFTDWGRDTMISLEGLTLCTGRHAEAGYILRAYGRYVKDGLIPNLFPEGETEGLYHTVDATLWYFHALNRYYQVTNDWETVKELLPILRDIVDHHIRGTKFNIRVDESDHLITQGEEGYQLTWMDAKVDGWVVTPRRGKAVEINALWYNALKLLEGWTRSAGDDLEANRLATRAENTRESFNQRFWSDENGYLFDIVDGENGDDAAFRPNQVFSISLDHPVLDEARWQSVLDKITEKLLTPFGLRTLAPGHADYKPTYDGDLRSRDAAYHQGTVWAWLIGPFIDAWLRVHPDDRMTPIKLLAGFEPHLNEACLGSISEIFDAEAPYYPRGCVAQAWSVAEVLRAAHRISELEGIRR